MSQLQCIKKWAWAVLIIPTILWTTPSQVTIISYAEPNAAYNLTTDGISRAQQLPSFFSQLASQGFGEPDIIFGSQRSFSVPGTAVLQTASPTSGTYQLPVHLHPSSDIAGLVNIVLNDEICDGKNVLIVWDFSSIRSLISALGYTAPICPSSECYALGFVLPQFPAPAGAKPTIVNQNLLAQDSSCGGITPPTPPTPDVVANYIPITVYNGTTSAIVNGASTTIADSQIYVFVQTNGGTKVMQFTSDGMGHMLGSAITPAPTPGTAESYYASYFSYPLSAFPSGASGFYTFYIPVDTELPSSRFTFSLINPLDWIITPATGHVNSTDDNFITQDDTYYTLYDKIEFTVTHVMLPWWQLVMNSTMVDYYCLPLSFFITHDSGGPTTSYTGISPTISRMNVMNKYPTSLSALPGSGHGTWDTLYKTYTPPGGSAAPLRIASANTGALKPTNTNPMFPMNYLSANPNSTCQWYSTLWSSSSPPNMAYYQISGNTLTIDLSNAGPGSGTATGSIDMSGNFTFTLNNDSVWFPGTVSFEPPVTIAPFFSGAYTDYINPTTGTNLWSTTGGANATTVGAIWQIFSCAVSVNLVPPPSPIGSTMNPLTKAWLQQNPTLFFQPNAALCNGPWYNFYSQFLHDNFAVSPYDLYYTAPFDDFLGLDGTIFVDDTLGVNATAAVYITIGDMTGSTIADITADSTMYTIVFAPLPPAVQNVTFNGVAVPVMGGTMGTFPGTMMNLSVEYTMGSYSTMPTTTFTTQVCPDTVCMSPILPGGANMVLSGTTLTIYLGNAPP